MKLNLSVFGHSFSDDEIGDLMRGISEALSAKANTSTGAVRTAYLEAIVIVAEEVAKIGPEGDEGVSAEVQQLRDAIEAIKQPGGDAA